MKGFCGVSCQGRFNSYYQEIIKDIPLTRRVLTDSGWDIELIFIDGKWCEIDTSQDLDRAKKMFD